MRLDDYRTSDNVRDDGEGSGGGGFGGGGGGGGMLGLLIGMVGSRFGIVGILVLLGGAFLLGINPFGGGGQQVARQQAAPSQAGAAQACASDPAKKFSCQVLASTEDTWGKLFQAQGRRYTPTTLVFYSKSDGRSGCGVAQSAMGPFYCPTDKNVYLDTSFYDELANKLGAQGDFAQAYVVAHEVGHHVQDLLGTLDKAHDQQSSAGPAAANAVQVRVELQADCFAGVWAANNKDRIEPGDVEEGLRAAHQIGDDTLQQEAQGRVVPDSFTHGTSAQRMAWLKRGLDSGDPSRCDTFAADADA